MLCSLRNDFAPGSSIPGQKRPPTGGMLEPYQLNPEESPRSGAELLKTSTLFRNANKAVARRKHLNATTREVMNGRFTSP